MTSGKDSTMQPATRCVGGLINLEQKRSAAFPRKSQPFARIWRCMDDTECRVRDAEKKCCAFATPIKRRITARAARRQGKSWRTAVSRACWDQTGPARWKNWKD